ncbi:PREDICTED: probable cytochrome P450 6t3 [Drosophila arizonae]|uniref:Probable cytochrome P450 6t3 n=1 Tax=Drosophila arizonae TaxID=7263 RepID=A0ABM1PKI6_DROAR|nr:PREDICTED: probable cytochrome P450 6t3 [Drosophila arizonae]
MLALSLALMLLSLALLYTYLYLEQRYSYFRRHRLIHIPASSWTPFGHLKQLLLLRISFGDLFKEIYADARIEHAKLAGFYVFQTPVLMLRDPELISLVLIKEFNSFLNRYEAADAQHDPMGALTLPLAKYPVWRESRRCMSQMFSSGRMKQRMYPLMQQVLLELEQHLDRRMAGRAEQVLPLSEMCQLYTTDVTGRLFYSWDVGGLRHGESLLRDQTKQLLHPNLTKVLHFMCIFFLPQWTWLLRAKVFAEGYARFMRQMVERQLRQRCQKRNPLADVDLLGLLEPLQRTQHSDFTASQAGIILLAGFETSSALLGFTLYELAKQPALQRRLKRELATAFGQDAQLSYETASTLPYLKMVCLEALRLYPAAAFINRECTRPEGFSLQPHMDYVIPPGMPAYISILGIQRDAKYWPNPLHFDPERFAPSRLKDIIPMTYIPFGAGPHGCIGSRLGLLQLKLGVAHILRRHRVEVCDRTVNQIRFNPKTFMLESLDELYLRFCLDPM